MSNIKAAPGGYVNSFMPWSDAKWTQTECMLLGQDGGDSARKFTLLICWLFYWFRAWRLLSIDDPRRRVKLSPPNAFALSGQ